MAEEFKTSVAYGLTLAKRIYYGKEALLPPVVESDMSKSTDNYLARSVMVYASIPEPEVVDNPDVPSYQPYVHGRCQSPALIPLQMNGVSVEVDCCLDYATISFNGKWRLHCVKTSRKCDCRVAVPIGYQGSILGLEVEIPGRSYHSQLIIAEEANENVKVYKGGDGRYLKGSIYTFRIPQVEGGTAISVKATWSQKLSYNEGRFCLNVPFTFPAFVNPISKISKREKILINVNSGVQKEILFQCSSHAVKELRREVGKVGLLYEAEVQNWSTSDLNFSYTIVSKDLFGEVFVQSPLLRDHDERQMFCFYLFPGNNHSKAFKKDVIFVIDISGSMNGDTIENTKTALMSSLFKLNPEDSFNIIAFNDEIFLFSSLMEPATKETITKANQWLNDSLTASGGTNIMVPLKQAMKLLADTTDSLPLIFLITDGTVEDEREICDFVKSSLKSGGPVSPRICTFGIGVYCNHYFLQMLAQIGRGYFDTAFDADSVDIGIQRLFTTATSINLANITVGSMEHLDSFEILPHPIPDLSRGSPLVVSGRYNGKYPDPVKISGILSDMSNFSIELKTQRSKDLQLDKVLARREIDVLTANAWMLESKELEQKVAKMSIHTGAPSEFTHMILHHTDTAEKKPETILMQEVFNKINSLKQEETESQKIILLGSLGIGFGNLKATAGNIKPGTEESKSSDAADFLVKAASGCCSRVLDRICCMCFIQSCTYMSDRCTIAFSQLCAALACFECVNCCFEICECECL